MGEPLSVFIVGAGLGGLATALSLAHSRPQRPYVITILEDASALAPVGAGLHLWPNVTRLLSDWNFLDEIEAYVAEPSTLVVYRYADGAVLAEDENFSETIRRRFPLAPLIDVIAAIYR